MLRKLQEKIGPKTQFVVTTAMLLLLPLLAALQYYWLGQLSLGEREQKKNHLRALANRFSQDFDQEIARVYAAFMPDRENWDREKPMDFAASYDQWTRSSAYPGLIKNIFLVELDDAGQLHVMRLNASTQQLEPSDWPEEMTALRQQLEEFTNDMRRSSDRWLANPPSNQPGQNEPRPPRFFPRSSFTEKLTALVLPLINPPKSLDPRVMPFPSGQRFNIVFPPPQGFTIVTLDSQYIRQEVLPALAKRHFTDSGELQYDLAVTNQRDAQQILYQFDSAKVGSANAAAASGWDVSRADISIPLFSLRFDVVRQLMRGRRTGGFAGRTERGERAGPDAETAPGGNPPDGPAFISFGGPPPNEAGGVWQLHIRHHAGSLEAAVANARRRNLIISFGILALLGGSVALMLLSSRRARRLAEQQMDFVAGISHELRTPLAVIDSAAYNLDKGVVKDPEQIKSYGALIRKETARLTGMVEQVLEFAGVQSGKQQYNLQPISLNEVIKEVLASAVPRLSDGGFMTQMAVRSDLPMVLADARALQSALVNLLDNAIKYSGESRWIGLRAEAPSDKQARIVISDRGLGIPEDDLPHIFEPFYRGHEVRAAQIRGNGLGLSLVKNIIESHGGQISVKSKAGEGSTFTITLPAIVEAAQPAVLGAELPTAN